MPSCMQHVSLELAADIVLRGGVIAYPTETVYGLGCDPWNALAVQRIFEMKGREPGKPLLLVASSLSQVQDIAVLDGKALDMAQRYWPGPLTLVLPLKPGIALAPGVTLDGQVAVRVSSLPLVQALVERICFPITSTSANVAGEPPCLAPWEIDEAFRISPEQPNGILEGGKLSPSPPSTVIRASGERMEILRQGAIVIDPYEAT